MEVGRSAGFHCLPSELLFQEPLVAGPQRDPVTRECEWAYKLQGKSIYRCLMGGVMKNEKGKSQGWHPSLYTLNSVLLGRKLCFIPRSGMLGFVLSHSL